MPARSQAKIRRDINRLEQTVDRHAEDHAALGAVKPRIASAAALVNDSWQAFQAAVVLADKERDERNTAIDALRHWVQRWRPVVLLSVPGAAPNLRALPSGGATPDDMLHVAEDLRKFIKSNPGAAQFNTDALAELGDGIGDARKEVKEATAARPAESATRAAFAEATISANEVLVRGTEIVRAIFGPTSPEYKQFIGRSAPADEEDDARDSETGEGGSTPSS